MHVIVDPRLLDFFRIFGVDFFYRFTPEEAATELTAASCFAIGSPRFAAATAALTTKQITHTTRKSCHTSRHPATPFHYVF